MLRAVWLSMATSFATRVVLCDPLWPDAGAGFLYALTMSGAHCTARPVVWQLACEQLSCLAARHSAVVFSLTACPVQEKAELQAAAEAAQHQLEAAAEAAAGEREAACSGLLAELQVNSRADQVLGVLPLAWLHATRRHCLWTSMLYAAPLLSASQTQLCPLMPFPAGCLPTAGGSAGLCCSPRHTQPNSCCSWCQRQ